MSQQQQAFNRAVAFIDAANSQDPYMDSDTHMIWPKELLYSHRMTNMLLRYASDPDDAIKLSVRAQHIERWKLPRSVYPNGRKGYLKWRTDLYKFHGDTVAKLLMQAGYAEEFIKRVKAAVEKKSLKNNPNSQLIEDVTVLVFIEYYIIDFTTKHPEYNEEKWRNIINKAWKKMSERAQLFALSGGITIPETLTPLIQKSISGN